MPLKATSEEVITRKDKPIKYDIVTKTQSDV